MFRDWISFCSGRPSAAGPACMRRSTSAGSRFSSAAVVQTVARPNTARKAQPCHQRRSQAQRKMISPRARMNWASAVQDRGVRDLGSDMG